MSDGDYPGGPLDVATLEVMAGRAETNPLVEGWQFQPDAVSPRRLELGLDDNQYPAPVETVRLDIRWFEGGNYAIHYLERRGGGDWQCRWDRHPKPGESVEHFHPPPDAAATVEPSGLQTTHHLDALFGVLDWIAGRIEQLHEGCNG